MELERHLQHAATHSSRAIIRSRQAATAALDGFKPGFLDKLLGRSEPKRQALAQAVQTAFAQDEQEYQKAYQDYVQRHNDWNERCQLAGSILQGDTQAYADALLDFNPFADISELGRRNPSSSPHCPSGRDTRSLRSLTSSSRTRSNSSRLQASFRLRPCQRGNSTRFTGISFAALPCGRARELFAFLPAQVVMVNIQAKLLNTHGPGTQCLETILVSGDLGGS